MPSASSPPAFTSLRQAQGHRSITIERRYPFIRRTVQNDPSAA
jgi:hypothetical protein